MGNLIFLSNSMGSNRKNPPDFPIHFRNFVLFLVYEAIHLYFSTNEWIENMKAYEHLLYPTKGTCKVGTATYVYCSYLLYKQPNIYIFYMNKDVDISTIMSTIFLIIKEFYHQCIWNVNHKLFTISSKVLSLNMSIWLFQNL